MSLESVEVYCCYSTEDEKPAGQLLEHLKVLERDGYVQLWSARQLTPGKERARELNAKLDKAKIILLLLSPDFHNDDDCLREVKQALDRHSRGGARAIAVLIRPSYVPEKLKKLTILPTGGKAVTTTSPRDLALNEITEYVKQVALGMQSGQVPAPPPPKGTYPKEKLEPPQTYFIAQLCDRRDQKEELKRALERQAHEMKERQRLIPLTCIVHGETEESLEGFKQRLKENDLYEILRLDHNKYPVKLINLRWPTRDVETADPDRHFELELSESLYEENSQMVSESGSVFDTLVKHPGPIMLSYNFGTANWNQSATKLISAFLQFWNDAAPVKTNIPVIACLFFSHVSLSAPAAGAERAADPVLAERRRRAELYRQRNEQARQELLRLKEFFDSPAAKECYQNICGIVLQELQPVRIADVEDWIDDRKAFARFCRRHGPYFCNPEEIAKIRGAIPELYEIATHRIGDEPAIPMDTLAKKLAQWLVEYGCADVQLALRRAKSRRRGF